MGVMGRANENIPGGGTGEPYLTKDELIRERTPLAITNVAYDPHGSRAHPQPRWLLTVEAWDKQTFPIPERAYPPDRDIEDAGLLSFNNNPTRQAQMESVQQQLEDMRAQGTEWIGPVAVITGKSSNNQPFKTLADVKINDDGTFVLDARGFPIIEGEEVLPPAPPPTPARRPGGSVAQQSTGQRERAAGRAQTPAAAPAAAPAAPTAAPRVSRSARKPATAPAAAETPAPQAAAAAPARSRRAPRTEPTPDAPAPSQSSAQYEAEQRRTAAREGTVAGPGPGIQERVELTEATSPCPHCGVDITARTYPASPEAYAVFYADSAKVFGWPDLTPAQRAAGGQSIPHANCPVLQRTVMLPVVDFGDE